MKPDCFVTGRVFRLIELSVIIGVITILGRFDAVADERVFLGPAVPSLTNSGANWLTGANGAGATLVDSDDTGKDGYDFTISNTVAGGENNGDWRCRPFSLGAAAGGARTITFSFAYKFVNTVAPGNNMHMQLRFFDATGTNFVAEDVIRLGAHTRDSGMTNYRTLTIEDIAVPRKARTADIWFNANIYEPWVSGIGRFNSFSVTTAPRSLLFKAGVSLIILICLGALTGLLTRLWRRRLRA